jgi:uncharacterized membrane protein
MSTVTWVFQGLLAAIFLASGSAKISMSRDTLLATGQTGIAPFPMPVVRLVAGFELLAAAALIVPRWSGVLPALSPLAAVGLGTVMIGAAGSHLYLREPRAVAVNALILLACVFVAVAGFIGY